MVLHEMVKEVTNKISNAQYVMMWFILKYDIPSSTVKFLINTKLIMYPIIAAKARAIAVAIKMKMKMILK